MVTVLGVFELFTPIESCANWINYFSSWENGEFGDQKCYILFHTQNNEKVKKKLACVYSYTHVLLLSVVDEEGCLRRAGHHWLRVPWQRHQKSREFLSDVHFAPALEMTSANYVWLLFQGVGIF